MHNSALIEVDCVTSQVKSQSVTNLLTIDFIYRRINSHLMDLFGQLYFDLEVDSIIAIWRLL